MFIETIDKRLHSADANIAMNVQVEAGFNIVLVAVIYCKYRKHLVIAVSLSAFREKGLAL